jgi:hypothetical protein
VLSTVYFNNQLIFKADEIDYIFTDWLLPAELYSVKTTVSQPGPEVFLSIGLAFSQQPG